MKGLANGSVMGATVSCCMSPRGRPKIQRREYELEDYPITTTEGVSEDTGTYLQHISDKEVPDGRCSVAELRKMRHQWTHLKKISQLIINK